MGRGEIPVPSSQEITGRRAGLGRDGSGRLEIGDRFALGPESDALVNGGQEAGRPVDRSPGRLTPGIREHDVGREVLVLRSQSVGHPGAEAGKAIEGEASVLEEGRRSVVRVPTVHRVDEGEIVHAVRQVGKEAGDPTPRFAVTAEFEGTLEDPAGLAEERVVVGVLVGLAVTLRQRRLVVEGVDVAHAAQRTDVDHTLGPGIEVNPFLPVGRRRGGGRIATHQPVGGDHPEAGGRLPKELASVDCHRTKMNSVELNSAQQTSTIDSASRVSIAARISSPVGSRPITRAKASLT